MHRLHLAFPVLAALGLLLSSCDNGTVTAPRGDVRGIVMVEGTTLGGVTVELTGPDTRSETTDAAGRYHFPDVPSGAYVVSVRNAPQDASFPATSRTAVVTTAQTVTVDFLGNFIRTASIGGIVTAGTRGVAGVTVLLRGAEPTRTTVTDANGDFRFTGLRAGEYEVEASGLPESVIFPSVRSSVSLATGETHLVVFEGRPELTASAVIRSIVRRTASGGTESADPQDLRGPIDVTVTVDRGEDTLESVDLLLGDQVVGRQFFDVGGVSLPGDSIGPQPAPAPFDLIFSVHTGELDPATGLPRFLNGERLLTARLATVEGGAAAWQSSIPVVLRNVDTLIGSVQAEHGPAAGDDGEDWIGGTLTITVQPVLYNPSRAISSVTVELRRVGGAQQRIVTVEGDPPFQVVLSGTDAGAPGNLVGYRTPDGSTDAIRVLSARYGDGTPVPGTPLTLASGLRIDNAPEDAEPVADPPQRLP